MLDNDRDKPLGGMFTGKIPPILVVAMFVAVVWMAFRIVTTVSPLMGSDEFAYLQTAHFDARHDVLFQLDPNMQRVENRVVPWLYAASASMAPTQANDTWRLANAIGFCLGAALIFAMLRRPLGERVATATAVLYLLFPFSFFATLILPELPFQLFVYLLAWMLTRREGPPRCSRSAVLRSYVVWDIRSSRMPWRLCWPPLPSLQRGSCEWPGIRSSNAWFSPWQRRWGSWWLRFWQQKRGMRCCRWDMAVGR